MKYFKGSILNVIKILCTQEYIKIKMSKAFADNTIKTD